MSFEVVRRKYKAIDGVVIVDEAGVVLYMDTDLDATGEHRMRALAAALAAKHSSWRWPAGGQFLHEIRSIDEYGEYDELFAEIQRFLDEARSF